MKAFQDGIAKLESADSVIFGISVDSPFANKKFAEELGVSFPLLSDLKREVVQKYGVYNDQFGAANRTTFVVDKQGVIRHIEEGRTAIDPTGAIQACVRLKGEERQ
jgi:peroxiredoxin (alkyl hydroperoxide reductase subunit C)